MSRRNILENPHFATFSDKFNLWFCADDPKLTELI